jgi:hypothetical protein
MMAEKVTLKIIIIIIMVTETTGSYWKTNIITVDRFNRISNNRIIVSQ